MANEINRILKLFADQEHGDCWTGSNFKDVLQGVDHELATRNNSIAANNIWQLVAHLTYWRTYAVNLLTGTENPPPFRDFKLPENLDETAWRQAHQDFEASYHLMRKAIMHFNPEHLDHTCKGKTYSYYGLMIGILQHDAYHLGQMVLLKKYA